jgi:hypothetical protein
MSFTLEQLNAILSPDQFTALSQANEQINETMKSEEIMNWVHSLKQKGGANLSRNGKLFLLTESIIFEKEYFPTLSRQSKKEYNEIKDYLPIKEPLFFIPVVVNQQLIQKNNNIVSYLDYIIEEHWCLKNDLPLDSETFDIDSMLSVLFTKYKSIEYDIKGEAFIIKSIFGDDDEQNEQYLQNLAIEKWKKEISDKTEKKFKRITE